MTFSKSLIAGLLVPALVTPAIAAEAVRPSMKPAVAAPKQDRSFVMRSQRAGAEAENESQIFAMGLPFLLLAVGAALVAVIAVAAAGDDETSPG